jgi:probable addiction module antidote protein
MTHNEKQRVRTRPFDAANYLGSEEEIARYLELVLEDNDSTLLAAALGDIARARARGMTQLAKDAGLSGESLYRSLSGERVPSGDTLLRVIHALGFRLGIQPQATK